MRNPFLRPSGRPLVPINSAERGRFITTEEAEGDDSLDEKSWVLLPGRLAFESMMDRSAGSMSSPFTRVALNINICSATYLRFCRYLLSFLRFSRDSDCFRFLSEDWAGIKNWLEEDSRRDCSPEMLCESIFVFWSDAIISAFCISIDRWENLGVTTSLIWKIREFYGERDLPLGSQMLLELQELGVVFGWRSGRNPSDGR